MSQRKWRCHSSLDEVTDLFMAVSNGSLFSRRVFRRVEGRLVKVLVLFYIITVFLTFLWLWIKLIAESRIVLGLNGFLEALFLQVRAREKDNTWTWSFLTHPLMLFCLKSSWKERKARGIKLCQICEFTKKCYIQYSEKTSLRMVDNTPASEFVYLCYRYTLCSFF